MVLQSPQKGSFCSSSHQRWLKPLQKGSTCNTLPNILYVLHRFKDVGRPPRLVLIFTIIIRGLTGCVPTKSTMPSTNASFPKINSQRGIGREGNAVMLIHTTALLGCQSFWNPRKKAKERKTAGCTGCNIVPLRYELKNYQIAKAFPLSPSRVSKASSFSKCCWNGEKRSVTFVKTTRDLSSKLGDLKPLFSLETETYYCTNWIVACPWFVPHLKWKRQQLEMKLQRESLQLFYLLVLSQSKMWPVSFRNASLLSLALLTPICAFIILVGKGSVLGVGFFVLPFFNIWQTGSKCNRTLP